MTTRRVLPSENFAGAYYLVMWPFWISTERKRLLGIESYRILIKMRGRPTFSQAVRASGSSFISSFHKTGNCRVASAEYFCNFSTAVTLTKLQTTTEDNNDCLRLLKRKPDWEFFPLDRSIGKCVLQVSTYKQVTCVETIITCAAISECGFYVDTSL